MDRLIDFLLRKLRPRVGWLRALLGFGACLCLPVAALNAKLPLPAADTFAWSALLGFVLGLRSAADPERRAHPLLRLVRPLFWLMVGGAGVLVLVLRVGRALPPLGLALQDAGVFADWGWQMLQRWWSAPPPEAPALSRPISRAWIFLAEALPRFQRELAAAPDAGERGAALLAATIGVALTWVSALLYGWALLRGRALLVWQLPLLAGLTLLTIFAGSPAMALVLGTGLLVLTAVNGEMAQREATWERSGTDYSSELHVDALNWGAVIAIAALLFALLLPAWINNPLALALWGEVEPPSGLAALDRQARPAPRPAPVAQVGLSSAANLPLGLALEQGDPQRLSLQIQVSAPLPQSSAPLYWRARLFDSYDGRGWSAPARIDAETPLALDGPPAPGLLLQTITDLREDRTVLIALPDVIGVDQPANAERLPDGAVAALTRERPPERYRVLSRPQTAARVAFPPEGAPPDMSGYTKLPGIPARVRELARAVAGGSASPAEQALALERYLRELPYTYTIPPLPPQGDAVDFFLFETRTGYCTYYASAMAVMARSLGIPARVATGYFTGSYDPASRTYTVYENEAHSWPELYLDGRWVAFEPTPIRPVPPARAGNSGAPVATPTPAPFRATEPVTSSPLPALLGLAAIIALVAVLLRRERPLPLALRVQAGLERLGRQAGVAWPAGATLHEYGALLAPRLGPASDAMAALVDLVERARYGRRELTRAEEQQLGQAWDVVRRQLSVTSSSRPHNLRR
ncbi:MAG: hypothetical protein OHK0022_09010 [Roseiflexaceae bacterium]